MKFLFIPMDAFGHVNASIGLARILRESGHQSVFIVPGQWRETIENYGFSIEQVTDSEPEVSDDPQKKYATRIKELVPLLRKSTLERTIISQGAGESLFLKYAQSINDQVSMIIDKHSPDAMIVDLYVSLPSVINSGKPWFLLYSANPLFVYSYGRSDRLAPLSGYSINDDIKLSQEFIRIRRESIAQVKKQSDDWLINLKVEPHPTEMINLSPYLNIYCYPGDVDYSIEYGPVPDKWFQLDHMIHITGEYSLGLDEKFFETSDKKIFFSLGSMGSADVDLMRRLIDFMSHSKHRFIVSKGYFHDQIELPCNMIGLKFVNQMKVLPKVDLVITHGGNNTFIETLYFGKPMIIMPLFWDQPDNAIRVEDKKIGRYLNPFRIDQKDLLNAMEELLNDEELISRVKKIGENMRASKCHQKLIAKLEAIVKENSNLGKTSATRQ